MTDEKKLKLLNKQVFVRDPAPKADILALVLDAEASLLAAADCLDDNKLKARGKKLAESVETFFNDIETDI